MSKIFSSFHTFLRISQLFSCNFFSGLPQSFNGTYSMCNSSFTFLHIPSILQTYSTHCLHCNWKCACAEKHLTKMYVSKQICFHNPVTCRSGSNDLMTRSWHADLPDSITVTSVASHQGVSGVGRSETGHQLACGCLVGCLDLLGHR